jgi:predicted DCC family thiol-disulfide oxidoreductase YuxK
MPGSEDDSFVVVYDGKCPFCTNYVRLMSLRKLVGRVELTDARSRDPIVNSLLSQGYDLDEGMVVLYGGRVYYGADAINIISLLTGQGSRAARFLALLLKDGGRARLFYPIMKFGRRITLLLLGIPNIASDQ